MRIAVLRLVHETVTFLPYGTMLEDFTAAGPPLAGEALLGSEPASYIGGFVKVAREFEGVELVGIESPRNPRTGTGSGWIANEAYELFVGRMIEGLRREGPFDGVFLSLHGAMGVEGVERPEAELARRVREAVGPAVPIAATFDPHGNEDEAFLRHADLAFCVKYYPHYDAYLQGERAARTLVRAIRGDYRVAHATVRVPILSPTVLQWTGASPWMDLIQRALTWEARCPDVVVNVFFGFPWCDVPDAGMTIQVLTNGDSRLAGRIAQDMAGWAWDRRAALLGSATVHRIADGVARARDAVAAGRSPVVLADHSDRSGAATWLLREVVAQGLPRTLVATVADRDVVEALLARGARPGDAFDMPVGGRLDESAGEPVRIQGRLLAVGEGKTWAQVGFGDGNVLAISRFLAQVIEPDDLRAQGLDPSAFDVIAIKSRVHFRRGFDDTGFAQTILLVEPDEPFLGTVRLEALPYRHMDRAAFYPHRDGAFEPVIAAGGDHTGSPDR